MIVLDSKKERLNRKIRKIAIEAFVVLLSISIGLVVVLSLMYFDNVNSHYISMDVKKFMGNTFLFACCLIAISLVGLGLVKKTLKIENI